MAGNTMPPGNAADHDTRLASPRPDTDQLSLPVQQEQIPTLGGFRSEIRPQSGQESAPRARQHSHRPELRSPSVELITDVRNVQYQAPPALAGRDTRHIARDQHAQRVQRRSPSVELISDVRNRRRQAPPALAERDIRRNTQEQSVRRIRNQLDNAMPVNNSPRAHPNASVVGVAGNRLSNAISIIGSQRAPPTAAATAATAAQNRARRRPIPEVLIGRIVPELAYPPDERQAHLTQLARGEGIVVGFVRRRGEATSNTPMYSVVASVNASGAMILRVRNTGSNGEHLHAWTDRLSYAISYTDVAVLGRFAGRFSVFSQSELKWFVVALINGGACGVDQPVYNM
ncbi:hypothetical protein Vi05172_g10854 [Venturia inaequalis]|nr:hypothetical protein Vi05172_g10854 [Venturia inaequalis]